MSIKRADLCYIHARNLNLLHERDNILVHLIKDTFHAKSQSHYTYLKIIIPHEMRVDNSKGDNGKLQILII